jgi:SAM-dependent methyltransferase
MLSAASFRDPGGFCFAWKETILRAVSAEALEDLEAFLGSATCQTLTGQGKIVATRKWASTEQDLLCRSEAFQSLADGREVAAVFEHERVAFSSFPYEWAPEMLHAAGHLTLDLAQACLKEGFGLKDATPYNILFKKSSPIFVDWLSFERRNPGDPIWKPHAQFCRTFLLPLLAWRHWGLRPADVLTQHRDGFDPSEVYRLCGPLQKLLPPFLTQVSIPTWLSPKAGSQTNYHPRPLSDPEKARFVLDSLFNRLRRALDSVRPKANEQTVWSGYMESHSYTETDFSAKEAFVREALHEIKPARVLDVGANTGHFSLLASQAGAQVVAIDYDLGCIGRLWRQAQADNLGILPLVVDLARPSAAEGWRNRECPSFLQRATGAFDLVLMLAVLHHLLVTERVPLQEVLALAAELTTRWLVIEFVAPQDPMFQTLTRGREHLHKDLTPAAFEEACQRRFRIQQRVQLPGVQRALYLLEKRDDTVGPRQFAAVDLLCKSR